MTLLGKNKRAARNAYTRKSARRPENSEGEGRLKRVLRKIGGLLRRREKTPRNEVREREKDAPRPKGGLHRVAALTLLLILAAGMLFGACRLSLWLYGQATSSSFFATRHIDISGNVRLTRDMVLEYAGIKEGDNCLAVGISDIERRLRATPWVAEASVKRLLPDRFVIRLKERMPSFWVQKDKTLYYANERGEIIAPVESENFLSLPTLHLEADTEASLPYLARLMTDMQSGGLPVEASAIASVSVSAAKGIEVYLEDRELRLSIATDDWAGNIARLGVTLSDLARRQELRYVREVRASDNSVWVILNRAAG